MSRKGRKTWEEEEEVEISFNEEEEKHRQGSDGEKE